MGNVANVEMLPVPMLPMANGAGLRARRPAGDVFNVEMWKCGNMQVWKYGNGMGAESGNVIAALGFCVR